MARGKTVEAKLDPWVAKQIAINPDYHFGDYTRAVARIDPVKSAAAVMEIPGGPSPLLVRWVSNEIEAVQKDSPPKP